jgi:hypothetical protein
MTTSARSVARSRRYRLREKLWTLSQLPSVKSCGRSVLREAGQVSLNVGADGVAGFAGVQTCSSVSACPVCSARVRRQKTAEVEAAGIAALRKGWRLAFLTLTMPHDQADDLASLRRAISKAWRSVQQSKDYRALRAGRVHGFIRAIEVTRGGSGWHPHVHVLLFLDASCGPEYLASLHAAIESRWACSIVDQGFRRPNSHGVKLQEVYGLAGRGGLLRYLTKVQDGFDRGSWGVGAEMTRGDLKAGRGVSVTPFEILEKAVAGDEESADLWLEYEAATKGMRCVEASRGLYTSLGVTEVCDELAPEAGPDPVCVALFDPADWKLVCRYRAAAWLLDVAETDGETGVQLVLQLLRQRAPSVVL